jgi:hypothetical protein
MWLGDFGCQSGLAHSSRPVQKRTNNLQVRHGCHPDRRPGPPRRVYRTVNRAASLVAWPALFVIVTS